MIVQYLSFLALMVNKCNRKKLFQKPEKMYLNFTQVGKVEHVEEKENDMNNIVEMRTR